MRPASARCSTETLPPLATAGWAAHLPRSWLRHAQPPPGCDVQASPLHSAGRPLLHWPHSKLRPRKELCMGGNVLPLPLVMKAFETHLSHLDPASPARLLSQAGPHAARVFAASPMSSPVVVPSAHLRLLLLPPFLARREAEARVVWHEQRGHRPCSCRAGHSPTQTAPLELAAAGEVCVVGVRHPNCAKFWRACGGLPPLERLNPSESPATCTASCYKRSVYVAPAGVKSPQALRHTAYRSEVTPSGVMSAQQQYNYSHSARAHAFLECLRLALEMPRALRTVG